MLITKAESFTRDGVHHRGKVIEERYFLGSPPEKFLLRQYLRPGQCALHGKKLLAKRPIELPDLPTTASAQLPIKEDIVETPNTETFESTAPGRPVTETEVSGTVQTDASDNVVDNINKDFAERLSHLEGVITEILGYMRKSSQVTEPAAAPAPAAKAAAAPATAPAAPVPDLAPAAAPSPDPGPADPAPDKHPEGVMTVSLGYMRKSSQGTARQPTPNREGVMTVSLGYLRKSSQGTARQPTAQVPIRPSVPPTLQSSAISPDECPLQEGRLLSAFRGTIHMSSPGFPSEPKSAALAPTPKPTPAADPEPKAAAAPEPAPTAAAPVAVAEASRRKQRSARRRRRQNFLRLPTSAEDPPPQHAVFSVNNETHVSTRTALEPAQQPGQTNGNQRSAGHSPPNPGPMMYGHDPRQPPPAAPKWAGERHDISVLGSLQDARHNSPDPTLLPVAGPLDRQSFDSMAPRGADPLVAAASARVPSDQNAPDPTRPPVASPTHPHQMAPQPSDASAPVPDQVTRRVGALEAQMEAQVEVLRALTNALTSRDAPSSEEASSKAPSEPKQAPQAPLPHSELRSDDIFYRKLQSTLGRQLIQKSVDALLEGNVNKNTQPTQSWSMTPVKDFWNEIDGATAAKMVRFFVGTAERWGDN